MTLEMMGLGAMIVLGLDLWAISAVIGAARSQSVKIAWIVAILVLPILGFVAWAIMGPRPKRDSH